MEVVNGVKETKEVLKLGMLMASLVAAELKDGFQLQDLLDLFVKVQGDEVKKAALDAALKDVAKVPAEIADISFMEGAELVAFLATELPGFLASLKA